MFLSLMFSLLIFFNVVIHFSSNVFLWSTKFFSKKVIKITNISLEVYIIKGNAVKYLLKSCMIYDRNNIMQCLLK